MGGAPCAQHSGVDIAYAVDVHGAGETHVTGEVAKGTVDYGTLKYAPSPALKAEVQTVTVTHGSGIAGNENSFDDANDQNFFVVQPDTSQLIPCQIVLEGSVPQGITELAFRLVAFSADLGVHQKIEFFSYVTNSCEEVDVIRVTPTSNDEAKEKMITIASTCDPARYIAPPDSPDGGKVKVRLSYDNFNVLEPGPVKFGYGVWLYVN